MPHSLVRRSDPECSARLVRGLAWRRGPGIVAPTPGAPRDWRASFLRRRAAQAAPAQVLILRIKRVVIAHGELPTADGAAVVRRVFEWLLERDRAV
jgi:hypothetical protein